MTAEAPIATGAAEAEAVLVVDALAAAYVTDQLYPKAVEQPIFIRAVETIRSVTHLPMTLHVGPGVFTFKEEEVATAREGAERLARRMFVHDVGAIEILGRIEAQDLTKIFELLEREVTEVEFEGGPYLGLMAMGVDVIRLVSRAMIEGEGGDDTSTDEDRDDRVSSIIEVAKDPAAIAADLADGEDDIDALAKKFAEWYIEVYALIGEEDVAGREEVVQAFVESFFYFTESPQVSIFREFLNRKDHAPCQVFLDQFSGHELAALAPKLDEESTTKLNQYARISSDSADARPEELLALLQSASEVKEAREQVARRVQSLIDGGSAASHEDAEWFLGFRDRVPTTEMHDAAGVQVLRSLLAVEVRDHRFHRLLRVWSGRAAVAIRSGRLADAVAWIEAAMVDPTYPEERTPSVKNALYSMATPEILEHIVNGLQVSDDQDSALELLDIWGNSISGRLMERLSEEEDPARRRVLIDLLGSIAKQNPASLFEFLKDDRWFVIRNLAVILGKSGRQEAVLRVRPLASHPDHRVRVEALRALATLSPMDGFDFAVEALVDAHPRVKSAALGLLRNSDDPRSDSVLIGALKKARSGDDARQAIEVMGARGTAACTTVLRKIASRRLAITSMARSKRDAARAALRKADR